MVKGSLVAKSASLDESTIECTELRRLLAEAGAKEEKTSLKHKWLLAKLKRGLLG